MTFMSRILPPKRHTDIAKFAVSATSSKETSQHKYIFVNDKKEIERLIKQARVINTLSGSYFDAPIHDQLENGITVLDSGCGPEVWTLEMSAKYPRSTFYGVDINPASDDIMRPNNCKFITQNILEPMPFPDDYFGFIHQQFLTAGIPSKNWPSLLAEMMRILKPGGWIELTEHIPIDIINCGPKFAALNKCIEDRANENGIRFSLGRELERHLLDIGAVDIAVRPMAFPMGHGGPNGEFWCENILGLFHGQYWRSVVKHYPGFEDHETLDKYLSETMEECARNKVSMVVYRYFARKPFGTSST
ncbi:S-adenosyl-L-methionine-dependent methyltransferase, partial [Fennellomyces sp. T-0311]